jgi:hypothetical protein
VKCGIAVLMLLALACDRDDSPAVYRKITATDLCMEREVFTAPSNEKLAGRLHDEAAAYRESPSETPRSAINFSIGTGGNRLDIWRDKDVVMGWYVREDKRYDQCSWIVSPDEVIFGPNAVRASTAIRQTGPAQWAIDGR